MSAPLSLLEALAQIPDPRSRHGRRHPLTAILSLTVLAMLSGAKSYQAIAQFGRDKGTALAHALGFTRGKTPAASCLCELYGRLDAVAFEAALTRWVQSRPPPPAARRRRKSPSPSTARPCATARMARCLGSTSSPPTPRWLRPSSPR